MRQGIIVPALRATISAAFLAASIAPSAAFAQAADAPAAAPTAPAAPAASEERGGVEEIIVTSQRREQSVQEVPIAMTAFTTELEQSTIRDIRDLNGYSANVRIDGNPDRAGGSSITIRGISPTRVDDNSLDSPIAVMIDGIYLGSLSGQVLENFDIERVEILRGPQGTLYGRNTVGGVIHVIRSEPTGEWGAKAQYTVGQYDQQEFRGVLNVPIIQEKLAAKLFFTSINRDGYFKNEFLRVRQPQRDYQNFGATIKATPTDWFKAVLTIEKFDDDSQGGASLFNWNLNPGVLAAPPPGSNEPNYAGGFLSCTGLPTAVFGAQLGPQTPCRGTPGEKLKTPNRISTDIVNPASAETAAYTLNMTASVSDNIDIVSVTGYRDLQENRKFDFDGSSGNFITIERLNDFNQFSQEVRLQGNWDSGLGNINFVAGAYYWRNEFQQDWVTGGSFWSFVGGLSGLGPNITTYSGYDLATNQWNPLAIAVNPVVAALNTAGTLPVAACLAGHPIFGQVECDPGAGNVAYGPNLVQKLFEDQTTKSYAFFAHADWEFIPNLTATIGIRYTSETKDFTGAQAYLAPEARQRVDAFPALINLDNKWTDVSPKAGLSWTPTEDILVYVTYAEGWHSGGFFGVNQNVSDFDRDQYDPETSQSIEGGVKTRFFDDRVQANFAYFWNKFRNKQEQSVQLDPSTNTVATVFSNVASAIYQGFEAELQVSVIEQLDLFATFGWLDAVYTNFRTDVRPNDNQTIIEDATFLRPRNAPQYSAGVGGTFTQPVGPGDAIFSIKYAYVSEIETSLLNLGFNRLDSRSDLQASLGYNVEFDGGYKVGIAAFGRNLTDEQFEVPATIATLFASSSVGIGRTWGIQLTGEF
jgi:iron complex outermembrane receptor protein